MYASKDEKNAGHEAAARAFKEGHVSEESIKEGNHRPAMRLRKGAGEMDAGWARRWEEDLRELSEDHPAHFRLLHEIVEGRAEPDHSGAVGDLRKWGYLGRDLKPLPDVAAVLTAGFLVTPDGPCVVNPFEVAGPEDARAVERLDKERAAQGAAGLRRLDRLLRRISDAGSGPAK